jgi:predicted transcriptional regulator
MNTITIRVCSPEEAKRNMITALSGDQSAQGAFITFTSWELLYKALSPKRMEILHAMTGAGELTFREIASHVGRDVKAVHTDVTTLIKSGLIERGDKGVIFPYDEMRFAFSLGHAAA